MWALPEQGTLLYTYGRYNGKNSAFQTCVGKNPILAYCVCLLYVSPLLLTQNTSLLTFLITKYVEVFPNTNEQFLNNQDFDYPELTADPTSWRLSPTRMTSSPSPTYIFQTPDSPQVLTCASDQLAGRKSEISKTSSLGSNNLPQLLIDSRKTFTSLWKVVIKDTEEQLDEELHRAP